ncbi:MAG: DKNYY domain-containing protein [Saprospiraceae bacterium]
MTTFLICILSIFLLFLFYSCKSKGESKKEGELQYGFSKVADTIRYFDMVLDNVDAQSFEILDEYYCKDKNHVFYHNTYRESKDYFTSKKHYLDFLDKADAVTFVSLDYGYGKDSSSAWYNNNTFEVSDIQSLSVMDIQFAKDKNHVYILRNKAPLVIGLSFERINTFYAKDANHYFFIHTDGELYTLKPIACDYNSFELLDFNYSKDHKNVFYNGEKIKGSTSENFQIIRAPYSKDHQNVYFNSSVISKADPLTFELYTENELSSGDTYYAKDKNHIFVNDRIFSGVDAATFKIFNEKYCMDKNGVYYHLKKVKSADGASFKVFPHIMGDADAEDGTNRYFEGKAINL